MTSNQIAYVKQREEARHNYETEVENQRHNYNMEVETQRSNVAREMENRRANDLNYAASIYSAQASMYNAELNYKASTYATQTNAATQRYIRDQQTFMQNQELNNLMFNQDTVNAESHRHNKAMEAIQLGESESKSKSAGANVLNSIVNGIGTVAKVFALSPIK